MSYGFTCGYCLENLDTPYDDTDKAHQYADAAGWRYTLEQMIAAIGAATIAFEGTSGRLKDHLGAVADLLRRLDPETPENVERVLHNTRAGTTPYEARTILRAIIGSET